MRPSDRSVSLLTRGVPDLGLHIHPRRQPKRLPAPCHALKLLSAARGKLNLQGTARLLKQN